MANCYLEAAESDSAIVLQKAGLSSKAQYFQLFNPEESGV